MARTHSRSPRLVDRVLLLFGFVSLWAAVILAHFTPPTGYELSPYSSTPSVFWVFLGCALIVSLAVSLRTTVDWIRRLSLLLGGVAAVLFVGLPIVRGYRYYGTGDALTHLGWMRGIRSGTFPPTQLEYPALHLLATSISETLGIDLTHAALLTVVTLSVVFFLFVALSTAVAFGSSHSVTVGAFSAFLLLPITTLSTYLVPHTMSQAILFSTFVLYLFLKYVLGAATESRIPSATDAVFAVTSIALVFYHPQLVAHLLVAFAGICGLQFLCRRRWTNHPIAEHRVIYGQAILLLAAFLAWTSEHGFFLGSMEYAASSAIGYFIGEGSAGESVDTHGASLAELGGSVTELFLKLFGPSLVFIGLSGLVMLWTLRRFGGPLSRATNGVVPYFTVSLVGLTGVFALYFLGSYGEMYFRVLGLMLLLVTIVGAITIAYGASRITQRWSAPGSHVIVAVGFGILLVASSIAVFPSPYIYTASPHVTEMSMEGHHSAFDKSDPDLTYVGIRAGPNRFADAVDADFDRNRHYEGVTSDQIEEGLTEQYEDDRYLTVTQNDRDRELQAFRGLRYSDTHFETIESERGVDRIHSNGEFELYHIDARSSDAAE